MTHALLRVPNAYQPGGIAANPISLWQAIGVYPAVDVVFDPVGGELSEMALRALGWGGRFIVSEPNWLRTPHSLVLPDLVAHGPLFDCIGFVADESRYCLIP
jgi:hypothetical protein